MGIFDFIKGSRKSKSENTEANVIDESKEIILTGEETQEYIDIEINERISNRRENWFNSFVSDSSFQDAAHIIVEHQECSTSLLQRKLKLGYNRASRIMTN